MIKLNKIGEEKELKLFNIPILQYGTKYKTFNNVDGVKYIDLFPKLGIREQFFNNLLKQLKDYDFDDVYICRMNTIGDSYFLNFFVKNWFKKHNSKKPIVVTFKETTKQIFEIFNPDIQCALIDFNKREALDVFWDDIKDKGFKYKGKNFYSYINKKIILDCHEKLSKQFTEGKILNSSFFHNLTSYYADVHEINLPKIDKKIKIEGLNTDNFVFISSEAFSNKKLSASFWNKLIGQLKAKGYNVFDNSKSKLNLKTTYSLAKKAKAIIALRSGLNDFLSSIDVPQHIIYTKFGCNIVDTAQENIEIFSLKHLPYVQADKIKEYDAEKINENLLIKNILKEL